VSPVVFATVGSLYQRTIVDTGKEPELLFLVSFLVTFGFIRTSAHMIRAQVSWWPGNVQVGGTHIHHLVWGICILIIVGYVGVAIEPPSPWQEVIAVLFGIGMGLTLDEFALWLNLKDVYWTDQGRRSIDAVIVAAALAGVVLIGFKSWLDVATGVKDAFLATVGGVGVIAIVLMLLNFSKEKFVTGVAALFFPPIGLVGAFRVAKPHSPWAHYFYKDGRQKKAEKRHEARRHPLRTLRERREKGDDGDKGERAQSPAGSG
jgi:hypothetical protein